MFDLKAIIKALDSLKDILEQESNEYIRDGVIQRFEYTFELCWKYMLKYFKHIGRVDIPSGPKPLIREAGKEGLINNVDAWFDFLQARNLTSHVYNEKEAMIVYEKAKEFPKYVDFLIKNLKKRF